MANQALVYDILTGKNTLISTLDKSKKKSGVLTKSMTSLGKSFGGVALKATGISAALGTAAAAFVTTKAVGEAIKLENALIGLQSVAAGTGNDVAFMTSAAKELSKDGLIPLADTAASLKNLLASGLSAEESVKTFKVLRDSASFGRQGMLDLGEAIKGATDGIKNGNSVMVDNAGITKNLSILYKEYADSIDKTVGSLSAAEKTQAIYTGLQREGALFTGDYAKLLTTFSGALSGVSGNFSFLLADIGAFITQSPVAIAVVAQLAGIFQTLRGFLEKNKDAIQGFVNSMIKGFVAALPIAIGFFQGLANGVSYVIGVLLRLSLAVNGVAQDFAELEFVKAIFSGISKTVALATSTIVSLLELIAGTSIGSGFIENILGLDADKTIEKLASVKEGLFKFADEVTGGEIAERLGERGTFISQLMGTNEEGLELLNTGLTAAKDIFTKNADELDKIKDSRTKKNIAKAKKVTKEENKAAVDQWGFFAKGFGSYKKFEDQTNKERADNFKSTLGTISSLTQSSNSTLFALGKAAAIANATIDGYAGVMKAWSLGPILGPPMAALVGVAAAVNIAKIASSKPPSKKAQGGFVGGATSSGDTQQILANSGELFLNRPQQAELFNMAKGNTGSSQQGGNQMIDIKVEIEGNQIARVIRDLQTDGFLAA